MSSYNQTPQDKHHFTVCDPRAIRQCTNIDRTNCVRTVPMQVLCVGLGRTGTNSLREALITLGYYDVYHYAAALQENPRDAELWNKMFEAKYGRHKRDIDQAEWDALLGHCMAVTDAPCNLFVEELIAAYPDAKVVLTVRDTPEQWWASIDRTLLPWIRFMDDSSLIPRFVKYFGPQMPLASKIFANWCGDTYLRPWCQKETALKLYADHIEKIKTITNGRVLVFNVKDGWSPLCKFLGKSIPTEPFPHINTAAQFEENVGYTAQEAFRIAVWNFITSLAKVLMAMLVVIIAWYAIPQPSVYS